MGYQRHKPGQVNTIFMAVEADLRAKIQKARRSTSNPQIMGRNGEKPIVEFLNKHLPSCFVARTGHFTTPSGKLSPQIDVMITDSRYPLLAENEDGSCLAMLHSVIHTIEVKLSLTAPELRRIRVNGGHILGLAEEAIPSSGWGCIGQTALAYDSRLRIRTLMKHYFSGELPVPGEVFVLRVLDSDRGPDGFAHGVRIWAELDFGPTNAPTASPLSDLYYELVQTGFYCLSARNYDFNDLGEQMIKYMEWGSVGRFPVS